MNFISQYKLTRRPQGKSGVILCILLFLLLPMSACQTEKKILKIVDADKKEILVDLSELEKKILAIDSNLQLELNRIEEEGKQAILKVQQDQNTQKETDNQAQQALIKNLNAKNAQLAAQLGQLRELLERQHNMLSEFQNQSKQADEVLGAAYMKDVIALRQEVGALRQASSNLAVQLQKVKTGLYHLFRIRF